MLHPCPDCSRPNPPAAKFCARCGRPLPRGELVASTTLLSPLMQQWRKLSTRLTRKEAVQLLGEPARVDLAYPENPDRSAIAPTVETWTYEYKSVPGGARAVVEAPAESADPPQRVFGLVRVSIAESRVLSWVEPDWTLLGWAAE